jgi:hypothetical protein
VSGGRTWLPPSTARASAQHTLRAAQSRFDSCCIDSLLSLISRVVCQRWAGQSGRRQETSIDAPVDCTRGRDVAPAQECTFCAGSRTRATADRGLSGVGFIAGSGGLAPTLLRTSKTMLEHICSLAVLESNDDRRLVEEPARPPSIASGRRAHARQRVSNIWPDRGNAAELGQQFIEDAARLGGSLLEVSASVAKSQAREESARSPSAGLRTVPFLHGG